MEAKKFSHSVSVIPSESIKVINLFCTIFSCFASSLAYTLQVGACEINQIKRMDC